MSKKLLQVALTMAAVDFGAHILSMYDEEYTTIRSKPLYISRSQPKKEYPFVIKGKQIMATSRKDAIKRYNHKYK